VVPATPRKKVYGVYGIGVPCSIVVILLSILPNRKDVLVVATSATFFSSGKRVAMDTWVDVEERAKFAEGHDRSSDLDTGDPDLCSNGYVRSLLA
jgi:hypothetical protein